jgi:formylmethanofuran dehydrogenase subunit E
MGLAALEILGIRAPVSKQTGLVILETDGCFADGVELATGATIGHRTLRVNDLGKIAGTFADVKTGRTIRLGPQPEARSRALLYAPEADSRYVAQLEGYQVMPSNELFRVQDVVLNPPLEAILSRPDARVLCDVCGEEVINEREIKVGGRNLCRTCAKSSYYRPLDRPGTMERHCDPALLATLRLLP